MIADIISYVSIASILLPIIFFVVVKQLIKNQAFNFLIAAILLSFVTEIVYTILGYLHTSNFIVGNIYTVFFFLILILFYKNLLPQNKNWLYIFFTLYSGFIIINTLFFQNIMEYQGYSRAFGGVLIIVCSLMYYRSLLNNLPASNVMQYGLFWVNTGITYYYSFNLLLFIYSNYVFSNLPSDLGIIFWSFHNVNNIVKNILFCVGIYYTGKP